MRQRSKFSRLLSLALCLCMVLAMLPALPLTANAANIASGTKLYLKPNNNWTQSNARFAAYFFSGSTNAWVSMTDSNGDGIYECKAPNGTWTNVIFCRMNPANSTNNWNQDTNLWNQTADLTYDGSKNLYTVAEGAWNKGSGSWSVAGCAVTGEHTYSNNTCTSCKKTKCQITKSHDFKDEICSVCGTLGTTIYFQNNKFWTNVCVYYWDANTNNGWPGKAMTNFKNAPGLGNVKMDHYSLTIPKSSTGFIINGKSNGASVQTANLTFKSFKAGEAFFINDDGSTGTFYLCTAITEMHKLETIAGKDATCTSTGLTAGEKCTVCGSTVKAQTTIGTLPHTYDENGICTVCEQLKCKVENKHQYVDGVCATCGAEEITIYFHNNWKWSEVKVHYWTKDGVSTTWPGVDVDYFGAVGEEHYSKMKIPSNVEGFIISGINSETGLRDQTINLTLKDHYDGRTYYISGVKSTNDKGEQTCNVGTYAICQDFVTKEELHNFVDNVCTLCKKDKCDIFGHSQGVDDHVCTFCGDALITIFFENNWKWKNISLYYWYPNNSVYVPSYPGLAMKPYGSNAGKDYLYVNIPAEGIEGFDISGTGTGAGYEGRAEETVDIKSGWYNGATYYITEREGNDYSKCKVKNFPICVDFPKNHKFADNKCAYCGNPEYIWIFFENCWGWSNVTVHYEGSRIANNDNAHVSFAAEPWPDGTNIYYAEIPADPDAIWFTGDGQAMEKVKTGWTHGTLYIPDPAGGYAQNVITADYPCALGHDYEVEVIEPTCITGGYTKYTCKREGCGYEITDNNLPEDLGNHVYGSYYVVNADYTHSEKCNACHAEMSTNAHIDEVEDGYCDICEAAASPVYAKQVVADLKGKIGLHYYLVLSDQVMADPDAYVHFYTENGLYDIEIPVTQGVDQGNNLYVFTIDVAVREMTEVIYMQVYANGEAAFAEAREYSVRAYAKHIMENYQDEKTQNLMESMVNFGAAAQTHFGYNSEDLANSFLDAQPDYSDVTISGFDGIPAQGTEQVKLYAASLLLTSETTLRLFFTKDAVITLNGERLKTNTRAGLYYVDITGIDAKDLDEDVTVVINDGTEEAEITYNPMTYCQSIQNAPEGTYTAEMQNLVRALYLYNQAANAYFEGE